MMEYILYTDTKQFTKNPNIQTHFSITTFKNSEYSNPASKLIREIEIFGRLSYKIRKSTSSD